jgi:hypothetical protein
MKPKKELIRIVQKDDGSVDMDITGKMNGRGAYICDDIQCFEKARKSKILNRNFSATIDDNLYNKLEEYINRTK